MQDILPTIGLAHDIRGVDLAPAVTAAGEPAVAIWAGCPDDDAVIVPVHQIERLVVALAACHAQAETTARDLRDLGGLA